MKRNKALLSLFFAVLLAFAVWRTAPSAAALSLFQKIPDPQESLGAALGVSYPADSAVCGFPVSLPAADGATENGLALLNAAAAVRRYSLPEPCTVDGRTASQPLLLTRLDPEKLAVGFADDMLPLLQERVDAALSEEEIYENGAYRLALLQSAFDTVLAQRLSEAERYTEELAFTLRLHYADGAWQADEPGALDAALCGALPSAAAADARIAALFEDAAASLPRLEPPRHYTIDENALAGPVPDPANFGKTEDPAVIEALLQRPEAQKLIGDEKLVWNADIERFPPMPTIHYYLDETILVLVWQEVEARGCGTFAEVFLADGSQLRRKIAGDELFSYHFETTSRFARDTNAVLALGGDFYHHGRACGVGFYQRELYRFEPKTCDVCFITSDGDMLFAYRDRFQSEDEARQFVADNDVLFSLVFGPVLIDDGVDVTPESYPWGEIRDSYARSALGLLGRHHYLTMNLNCYDRGHYYYLATLRQAADAMIKRGCLKAYTLDGGQTATTVFGGELINPVQFGWEKEISDIIYFATAIPNE